MTVSPALLWHSETLLGALLTFESPADQTVSRYFRSNPGLGQRERGFIAETVYAVLRRLRSLETSVGARRPRELVIAALARINGLSVRTLSESLGSEDLDTARRARALRTESLGPAQQAELPDWLWVRLAETHGEQSALGIARGLMNAAPFDLRVNLARIDRDSARERLAGEGIAAAPTPLSPAGLRVDGNPGIQRSVLFRDGLVEVQDEGSQLLAYLAAPRRGERIADFCAGAGGKTLALAMLMRGTGRIHAMDTSAKRLAALSPRAARAGVSNIHATVLSGSSDARVKRLSGKLDRVLVDAPCSGFGTLRRNPDLKWRHAAQAIGELADKQSGILGNAARLVRPGGRLIYATCSILEDENEAVVRRFLATQPEFTPVSCGDILAAQRIDLACGAELRLWPHLHATDGFYAAVFERQSGSRLAGGT